MRKYIRSMLRNTAEKEKIKASKYVHDNFEEMQIKKYGATRRKINEAKGAKPRRKWKNRILVNLKPYGSK